MLKSMFGKAAVFFGVILLVSSLAWITLSEPEDPCAGLNNDVGAAILAEPDGDQDALINRAIILKGKCKKPAETQE